MSNVGSPRLLERLVADGLLGPEQQEATLNYMQRSGERVEEALLDMKFLEEVTLLKYLAALHKTRFVSTEKLAKADIDRLTLDKVPKKLAERELVFPVLYDTSSNVLSVVTPNPDNAPALHDIQLASNLKEVRAFVGRPRSVKAAIGKAYNGDIHAFATLDRSAHEQFTTMLNVYERNLVSEESITMSIAKEATTDERVLSAQDFSTKATSSSGKGIADDSYLETLNVLVSLIENTRQDLRGHSAQVARLVKKICERIGLPEMTRAALIVAAHVHDLGKMGAYHLTALNVSEYEGHRAQAVKQFKAPLRLLEAVSLPREVAQAVEQMYERYDGKGLPEGASGKEIALGARLLAIADTYADLTQNPRNPFRKTLRPVQACEVLERYRGTVFDPNLVDLFKHTVTGEDLKARLLANRYRALVVDPDPEETTVLELRMVEQGFEVAQARATDQALKILEKGEIDIVVSELELQPIDGFALLAEARKHPWGQRVPWVIVTGRAGGRADAQKAFELGAIDFLTKPLSSDLLVAKLKQIIEREAVRGGPARGVAGSLQEMGLPEMVQVLWYGRKTGSLKIRSGANSGEIHFVNGAIYNALWSSLRGEEAFFAMLGLGEGEFSLDPNFTAPQQVIQDTPEALLLEGMRRLDEAGR
ncbi:MAG TPA: HD domain-containing phosphohydrolase [Polyangiaceae bacterium]|jgi:response regulator RpfG family c-di-GMP phosphodiesterase|nr:HD domain-containing phosphohydrolase [Polyangiaceae bacterium]